MPSAHYPTHLFQPAHGTFEFQNALRITESYKQFPAASATPARRFCISFLPHYLYHPLSLNARLSYHIRTFICKFSLPIKRALKKKNAENFPHSSITAFQLFNKSGKFFRNLRRAVYSYLSKRACHPFEKGKAYLHTNGKPIFTVSKRN